MSILQRIIPNFLRAGSMALNAPKPAILPSITIPEAGLTEKVTSLGFFGQSIRTVIRCHFPRPSERKRIKRHGYKTRMSTPGGRRVLMRRILKGKWVLSH